MDEKAPTKFETVLITGASSGIGLELARIFAREGYNLLLVSRDKSQLTQVAVQIRSEYKISVGVIAHDLAKTNSAQDLYNTVKKNNQKVSILVNNAGFGGKGEHISRSLKDEESMIELNVQTLVGLTRLFATDMAINGGGKILNVASIAGFIPCQGMAVYFATKAFVVSYSQAIAAELKNKDVIVSCLCPGATKTRFLNRAGITDPNEEKEIYKGAMEADVVAQIGFDGLMKGKTIIVPGIKNKLIVFATRFRPLSFVMKW